MKKVLFLTCMFFVTTTSATPTNNVTEAYITAPTGDICKISLDDDPALYEQNKEKVSQYWNCLITPPDSCNDDICARAMFKKCCDLIGTWVQSNDSQDSPSPQNQQN